MNEYKITLLINGTDERTETWSGWDEKGAITQAFVYHTQAGARELKVLDITQK